MVLDTMTIGGYQRLDMMLNSFPRSQDGDECHCGRSGGMRGMDKKQNRTAGHGDANGGRGIA